MKKTGSHHPLPSGTNIRMLLQNCQCSERYFFDAEQISQEIQRCLRDVGLTFLQDTYHCFEAGGYTLAVILSESHVVIHTWAEHSRMVLVEISICDFSQNNRTKSQQFAQAVERLFQSQKTLMETTGMIPRVSKPLSIGHGFYVDMEELLETRQSKWQRIAIAKTQAYGKALLLDDVMQTTEADHAFYHEPLVHVPMLHHENSKRVLICGGGDGGAAYEVLKHPGVQACDIVEIDKEVIDVSRKHLQEVHQSSIDDPRVTIHIADAVEYVGVHPNQYDVVIIDATNPVEEGVSLYSLEFMQKVKQCLKDHAVMGIHAGLPYIHQKELTDVLQHLDDTFPSVIPYVSFVPSFGTVSCFCLCMKEHRERCSRDDISSRMRERQLEPLEQISPELMDAWFVVPSNL